MVPVTISSVTNCAGESETGGDRIEFSELKDPKGIEIQVKVKSIGKTGVEMEALTAAAISALTIYDMCKGFDKTMIISNLRLVKKTGGKSGDFARE